MTKEKTKKSKVDPLGPKEPAKVAREGYTLIQVTSAELLQGVVSDPRYCPLARAANNCIAGVYYTLVTHTQMTMFYGSKRGFCVVNLPEEIAAQVRLFDYRRVECKPFDWEVETCTLQP